MDIIGTIIGFPLLIFVAFWIEVVEHTKWKWFGKHVLPESEIEYNRKIEVICKSFDDEYEKMMKSDDNLMLRVEIPYSAVKKTLEAQFEIVGFSESEKKRAMREVNGQNARNSSSLYGEYEFAIGGRSKCFLLQTFLRDTKFAPDPEPKFVWQ